MRIDNVVVGGRSGAGVVPEWFDQKRPGLFLEQNLTTAGFRDVML
jgi:hypothetical protein